MQRSGYANEERDPSVLFDFSKVMVQQKFKVCSKTHIEGALQLTPLYGNGAKTTKQADHIVIVG